MLVIEPDQDRALTDALLGPEANFDDFAGNRGMDRRRFQGVARAHGADHDPVRDEFEGLYQDPCRGAGSTGLFTGIGGVVDADEPEPAGSQQGGQNSGDDELQMQLHSR